MELGPGVGTDAGADLPIDVVRELQRCRAEQHLTVRELADSLAVSEAYLWTLLDRAPAASDLGVEARVRARRVDDVLVIEVSGPIGAKVLVHCRADLDAHRGTCLGGVVLDLSGAWREPGSLAVLALVKRHADRLGRRLVLAAAGEEIAEVVGEAPRASGWRTEPDVGAAVARLHLAARTLQHA